MNLIAVSELARRECNVEQNAYSLNYIDSDIICPLGSIPDLHSKRQAKLPIQMVSEQTEKTDDPRFEEALSRLEAIVESIETGETPLDELIGKYEEGVGLLKACHTRLREAELKIEEVKRKNEGLETEPFENEDS